MPTITTNAKCCTGTLPINMINKQVISSKIAVDILAIPIKAVITPMEMKMGSSVPAISVMLFCRLASIAAKAAIKESLAKSEGWKAWLITGITNQRLASLMLEPNK